MERIREGEEERVERIREGERRGRRGRGREGRQREGKKRRGREGGRGGGGKKNGKVGWITEGRESPLLLPLPSFRSPFLPSLSPFFSLLPSTPPSIPTHSVRVELKQGYKLTTHFVLYHLELNLSVDTGKVPVPV